MFKQSLDYFLADKQGADLSDTLIAEACQTLRTNRGEYLAQIGNESIISKLTEAASLWLSPDYELRKLALAADPAETGFPHEVLATGLDACFSEWTQENFFGLLNQEFGDPTRLQSFGSLSSHSLAMVHGPQLIAHIAPGNLPAPIFQSIAFGLLLRSAQFVKCASGKSLLPRLFGHSLHYVDPGLASVLEIAEWDGGNEMLEGELFKEADCVVATGSDKTVQTIRKRLPLGKQFVGYGHRVSLGYIEQLANEVMGTQTIISRAADDVVAWNQQGCLSPHVIYVEEFGNLNPDRFAEMLAEELTARSETLPRGEISTKEAATIANMRRFYKIRSANNVGAIIWESENSTEWTVVQEDEKQFQTSPLNRFIFVKPIEHLDEMLHVLEPYRENISTVGIAASEAKLREFALKLGEWGVPRVCPLGKMQRPPLALRHDGRPTLGDLVRWTDLEII
ncbi:MAG: hypothetical protein CBC62_09245 [Opitutia bacterium TMED102]|nr:hypothetical protein [Verrucomicrobiales bacterium]OUV36072.1 MAG: hypothetical protein CBC62_09245 [Opitutae bacterium TMED102]